MRALRLCGAAPPTIRWAKRIRKDGYEPSDVEHLCEACAMKQEAAPKRTRSEKQEPPRLFSNGPGEDWYRREGQLYRKGKTNG